MFLQILLSIFLIFLLYFIYRIFLKITPKLFYNPSSPISKIINSINFPYYHPVPYLFNGFLHSIWSFQLRGLSPAKPTRQLIKFKTGGSVMIDIFTSNNITNNSPILFISHSCAGGTREPCTNYVAYYFMKKNYISIVCSSRGCNGSEMTSEKGYTGLDSEDLHEIIEQISEKFPNNKKKFIIGFSIGSCISIEYVTNYSDVDGCVCVSHPINMFRCVDKMESTIQMLLFMKPLMNAIKHLSKKNKYMSDEDKKEVYKMKSIRQFHKKCVIPILGLTKLEDYYHLFDLDKKFDKIKVPTLIIDSEDDPFLDYSYMPFDALKKCDYVAYMTLKEGGHCGFCQNMDGKGSYIEDASYLFFEKCSSLNA